MINDFKTYLSSIRGYSPQTIAGYCRDLRQFARWAQQRRDDARWSNITRDDIDNYLMERCAAGIAPATTNRALSSISALYMYMKRQGMDVINPTKYESRRKIADTVPNTIPYEDLERAYAAAHGVTRVLLGLLITTGMRIGEVLAMMWEDIDFHTGRIKVHGKGAKERVVITTGEVLQPLLDNVPADRRWGRLFYFTQRTARSMIYDALRNHTHAKQQSPHAIRHTVATHLAQCGVNSVTIARVLGHNRVETSEKYINAAAIDVAAALTTNNILRA